MGLTKTFNLLGLREESDMVTIKTIADKCGISYAAVSKALNYQPGISEDVN